MEKIKKHFQENFLIYLILITCIIVFLIIYNSSKNPEAPEIEKVDTSVFHVVNVYQALELFNNNEPTYLVIGADSCSATHEYVKHLRYEVGNIGLQVYYLDYSSIDMEDKDKKDYENFLSKLDIDYNLRGVGGTFKEFMGVTPMTIIIKNKKQVYGYIGSMNNASIESVAKLYGLHNEE